MTESASHGERIKFNVVFFVAVISLGSVGFTVFANYIMLDKAEFMRTLIPGIVIAVAIAVPVSTYVGLMMKKIKHLNAQLAHLAAHDFLTSLATRKHFFERVAEGPPQPGVVLALDVDHFKKINDAHGHLVGDAVLKALSKTLRQSVRRDDVVSRFGGEEFVIFLENTDIKTAELTAERLRERVAATRIESGGAILAITISIGGALKYTDQPIDVILQRADTALYEAKHAGRNKVIFFDANTLSEGPKD